MSREDKNDELVNLDLDLSKWSDEDWTKFKIKIKKIALNEGFNNEDAEDIASETIVRIWKKRKNSAGKKSSFWWSLGFLKYIFREYWKKIERKRKEVDIDIVDPAQVAAHTKNSDDYFKITELREENAARKACAEECIKKISPEKWKLYYDYYLTNADDKSRRKDMAEKLGIKETALRKRIFDIKQDITGCLTNCIKRKGY